MTPSLSTSIANGRIKQESDPQVCGAALRNTLIEARYFSTALQTVETDNGPPDFAGLNRICKFRTFLRLS